MKFLTAQQLAMTLVFVLSALVLLPGCVPMGFLTAHVDKVCRATDLERERIRANVDTATYPHKIRVECN